MGLDLNKVFGEDVIIRYSEGMAPVNLTHTYSGKRLDSRGSPIPFDRITSLLGSLREDVDRWYKGETGNDMDVYSLGGMLPEVRQRFWDDERFLEAFDTLEMDPRHRDKALIPWWNEVAAGEMEHSILSEEVVHVKLGPRHSLETQLMREGVERPVRNISVAGIIVTAPGKGGERHAAIGLRGGSSYPNTYHITAGALMATEQLKKGLVTIYDVFRAKELRPEFGVTDDTIEKASINARIYDHVLDMGPMYVFVVETRLGKDELLAAWGSNTDSDKGEHSSSLLIPANPDGVNGFIRAHYIGALKNRERGSHERHLLHPGALALASFSGMGTEELRGLYKDGIW